ncbi:MAG: FAD-dependent oxidoreductase [Ignavibacteriales bacterium]|nr:FAD-dependent oxidoreductase [Ignavibacteriales bacterium]
MKRYYDVVVVGGGPAGSMAARYAAELGVSVLILEKDRDIGYPVRCGEAVSRKGVEEFIEPDEKWIASHITKLSMNAPDGTEVVLPSSRRGICAREKSFDYELAKSAANAGVEISPERMLMDFFSMVMQSPC